MMEAKKGGKKQIILSHRFMAAALLIRFTGLLFIEVTDVHRSLLGLNRREVQIRAQTDSSGAGSEPPSPPTDD